MDNSSDQLLRDVHIMTVKPHDDATPSNLEESNNVPSKRNRSQLSCTHCRQSKLKCDRARPCSQCTRRGRASKCTFLVPAARKRPAASMQLRLKHLESLVKVAMASQPSSDYNDSPSTSHAPETDSTLRSHGSAQLPEAVTEARSHARNGTSHGSSHVVVGTNETAYIGATHWAAMLEDIEEVKNYFNEAEGQISTPDDKIGPDLSLIFKYDCPSTKEGLLAALPDRTVMNRLIHKYFNSSSPALHLIHKPTFQRQYQKFWADPQSSPISWLAFIYSIMSLATFAALSAGEGDTDSRGTPMDKIRIYRGLCAQCLSLSSYSQPGPYLLETFLIYIEGDLILSKGDQVNCYLLIGATIRLALRMGVHRDADIFKDNITPYRGEIRRRIWHLLLQMDLMISFHNGLPSMVQAIKSDTQTPRNLRDQDFDEDTKELPPSRPEIEMTGMSYTLAKGRIARAFGKVVELANLLTPLGYPEVVELDEELRQAFAAVPPFLRIVPIELSVTDTPQLIIQRFSLAVLYYKSLCVLHRRYLMMAKDNAEFSYSNRVAIDASMELLKIQSEAHDAVQPGGPLCKDTWFISSLSMHDLLLAATILYLSLFKDSDGLSHTSSVRKEPTIRQVEMIKALKRSYEIWTKTKSLSIDTKKAYDVLSSMLKRIDSRFYFGNGSNFNEDPGFYNSGESLARFPLREMQSQATSTGITASFGGNLHADSSNNPSSGFTAPTEFENMNTSVQSTFFETMLDASTNFDWDMFDDHLRPPQIQEQAWPDWSFEDFNFGDEIAYTMNN